MKMAESRQQQQSRLRRKKRKAVIIYETSSSDEETTPLKGASASFDPVSLPQDTPRSSERLQKKRCREFCKPSREDVWRKITPTKSPGKYEQLRPKRLVNNYTKENNRYNYDPNETSGDESMDDFLDDSISEQSRSDDDSDTHRTKQKHQIRIKGRRRRLLTKSGSEESSSTDSDCVEKTNYQNTMVDSQIDRNDDILSGDSAICIETSKNKTGKLNAKSKLDHEKGKESDEESEEVNVTKTKKTNRSIIESDDSGTSDTDANDDVIVKKKHNRSIVESDEDDSSCDMSGRHQKSENIFGNGSDNVAKERLDGNSLKLMPGGTGNDNHVNEEGCLKSESSKNIDEKNEGLTPSTSQSAVKADNPVEDITVIDDSESEISDSETDNCETSEDTENEVNDNNETMGVSSRVRVQMLKKKNERKEMFEKFKKERQRRLSKEH